MSWVPSISGAKAWVGNHLPTASGITDAVKSRLPQSLPSDKTKERVTVIALGVFSGFVFGWTLKGLRISKDQKTAADHKTQQNAVGQNPSSAGLVNRATPIVQPTNLHTIEGDQARRSPTVRQAPGLPADESAQGRSTPIAQQPTNLHTIEGDRARRSPTESAQGRSTPIVRQGTLSPNKEKSDKLSPHSSLHTPNPFDKTVDETTGSQKPIPIQEVVSTYPERQLDQGFGTPTERKITTSPASSQEEGLNHSPNSIHGRLSIEAIPATSNLDNDNHPPAAPVEVKGKRPRGKRQPQNNTALVKGSTNS